MAPSTTGSNHEIERIIDWTMFAGCLGKSAKLEVRCGLLPSVGRDLSVTMRANVSQRPINSCQIRFAALKIFPNDSPREGSLN